MNEMNCQNALMIMMAAELDGEETSVSLEEAAAHLASCANCRQEFEQLQNTFSLLRKQTRRAQDADLWSAIETRIDAKPATQSNWQPFLFLGVLLVAYKLLEMLPETDFGFMFKIVPLIFVIALFVFLKENPFKINTELILEK